jgi:hypothetical protein
MKRHCVDGRHPVGINHENCNVQEAHSDCFLHELACSSIRVVASGRVLHHAPVSIGPPGPEKSSVL